MKVSQRKQKQKIHHYWLQQDKQHQYVIFTIWEETFMSGRLSPIGTRAILTLYVEAVTATISRIFQPVFAITILTMPAIMSGSGSLYLCRPEPCMLEFEHS